MNACQPLRRLAVLAVAALLAACAHARHPRALEAAGFHYLVFETRGAAPDASLPMIVGLHYSGATPAAMAAYFDGFDEPVRVVLPQGPQPRSSGYSWFAAGGDAATQAAAAPALADDLAAFVRAAEATHPTPGKPLAMGVSYGGDLALLLALRHPSLVGAAFPVAARAFPQWLAAAVPCAPGCPPIRALHGDADATVPPGAMAAAIPRLQAAGYDATLQTYPGIAHDFAPAMEADFVAQATRTICVMLAQCPAPSPDSSMP